MPIPSAPTAPPRRLLADGLYEELLAAVLDGTLEPGEMVSEVAIATQAGISRTPAREALDRLAAVHLVEVLPRRGTRITELDEARYTDTLEALLPIVVETTRMAVALADDRQRRGLVTRIDEPGADLFRVDGLFEYLVVVLRSDRVERAWNELVPHVRRRWTIMPETQVAGLNVDERTAMLGAVGSGDTGTAAGIVRAWFDRALDRAPGLA